MKAAQKRETGTAMDKRQQPIVLVVLERLQLQSFLFKKYI